MEVALIFGSNGQDGWYLKKHLEEKKIKAIGISRRNADIIGEVQDKTLVSSLMKRYQPKFVFHLAANSSTSHDAIWENNEAISIGTLNLLEAVKEFSFKTKVFLSGSGLQFENKGFPIKESAPFVATSPYVVSRNHSVYAARYYRSLGLNVYVGYFFNHDSPLRPERHMAQKIAHFCKKIDHQSDKLRIGNTKVKKEWTFAGDVVEAVWILVNQDKVFECIIGSGLAYSIEEWLEVCFNIKNKSWKDYVLIKEGFIPQFDVLVSKPDLIKSLGWVPKVSFQDLAKKMIVE